MPKRIDLIGQRFGRLTVVEELPAPQKSYSCRLFVCECDCGAITHPIDGRNLVRGHTTSCGCQRKERVKEANSTHGMKGTSIYTTWINMKDRCYNQNHRCYKHYGGRGITVCKEWKDSFQEFFNYVSQLSHFDEKGYSLDRINNNGNYEPGNVRWATAKEQSNNRRTTNAKHTTERRNSNG